MRKQSRKKCLHPTLWYLTARYLREEPLSCWSCNQRRIWFESCAFVSIGLKASSAGFIPVFFLIEIYGFEGTGLGRYGVPRNGIVSVAAFHQSVNKIDRLIAKSSIREEK